MIDISLNIIENTAIAKHVYRLKLGGRLPDIAPGQFVMLTIPGYYLRRPISVCEATHDTLTLIYKVMGEGTRELSACQSGSVQVLLPLGNGFSIKQNTSPLLIGGGVGVPPLLMTGRLLKQQGMSPVAVLGFNTKSDVFLQHELAQHCNEVHVTTMDGSYGTKGVVTDVMGKLNGDYFYACGPMPMLRALCALDIDGQVSLEERMGCGFGACMGCSCHKGDGGSARICKEGPVFYKGEIKF